MPNAKVVKPNVSNLPAGLYRANETLYARVGGSLRRVEEGTVLRLDKGEANKKWTSLSINAPASDGTAKILNALNSLDVDNNAQWTAKGLPQVSVVQSKVGDLDITREVIESIQPGFCRDILIAKRLGEDDPDALSQFGQGRKKGSNHEEI